ncbi:unnamed protein product [Rotaria sordida]|uniref:F-box domain-containing protein n=1 Tax=Rotaria sordida TaxID=392033 RepID=A0A813YHP5_9BILA|nr:unnamed protein product [Rotaria sordida]
MERMKRQETDAMDQNSNNIKRRKLKYESNTFSFLYLINSFIFLVFFDKSLLEDLPHEIFYDIFEYFDMYHIYKGFFNLNKRFRNLITYSNFFHKINISIMSKNDFEGFHVNIIIPNRHRIISLRLSNPFIPQIVFSSSRVISQFIHLEQLVLNNIEMKYLRKILDYLTHTILQKLHSLNISIDDSIESLDILFTDLFNLSTLKYCEFKYETKTYDVSSFLHVTKYNSGSIEYLIINGRFPFKLLNNLLCCLPKLHYLSINSLVDSYGYIGRHILSSILLNDLKCVSFKLDNIRFFEVETIFKDFFHSIQILRLTTSEYDDYLNAEQWEKLIVSYMPCLRIFDINHTNPVRCDTSRYHALINGFDSLFWIERKWFFTYQYDWSKPYGDLLFYSTNPHRYEIKNVYLNYFPNITQMTIKCCPRTPNGSITTILDYMIPLKQLKKLTIQCHDFSFEELVKLLSFAPNLNTLKLKLISVNENDLKLIQQTENFQYVSKTNQIKHLDLFQLCEFNQIELIINLFSQLEYLKTGINYKEIRQIKRYLLSKINNKTRHLFFLCVSGVPKICLKELNVLIKSENLLNDYCIRFINRDLYLWW